MKFVHVELKRDTWAIPEIEVRNPEDAVMAVKNLVQDLDREMVISIHTAASGRVINASVVSVGSMVQAITSPAEILRTALVSGAHGILLVHNHPSGNCQPSREDLHLSKRIATACEYMGLHLLDFIIVGAYGYSYSVQEQDIQWLQPDQEWLAAAIAAETQKKQRRKIHEK